MVSLAFFQVATVNSLDAICCWFKLIPEVWMIERFAEDWGLRDLGLEPSYFPKGIPPKAFHHLAKETSKAVLYLIP
jgi:hypothetical protein